MHRVNKNNKYIRVKMSKTLNQQNIKIQLTPNIEKQLKIHAIAIQKKQQQQMKQKLERENEKINKIKEIQNNFVKWVESKTEFYQTKIQKVEKNKEDQIAKIIKKCKDRDKYVTKKQNDCIAVKKKSLNIAWKKAEKFNDDIQSYYKSKQFMNRVATAKAGESGSSLLRVDDENIERRERATEKYGTGNNNSVNIINTSKIYNSLNSNNSIFRITDFNQTPKIQKPPKNEKFVRISSATCHENSRQRSAEVLQKVKLLQKHQQSFRIQQLGEKMQKIEQSRARKQQNHQKKSSKQGDQRQRNLTTMDFNSSPKKIKSKSKTRHQERLMSQQSYKRQIRLKDRAHDAKLKRNELFEQHLVQGEQYLQNIKIRHLKNVIAKNIAYNTMQKKLYMERLNKLD